MSARDYRRNKSFKHINYELSFLNSITRRIFCFRIGQASILTALLSSCSKIIDKKEASNNSALDWESIEAIYQHFFPTDNFGPDAKEINATNYLKNIYQSKITSGYRKFTITEGTKLVNNLSNELYSTSFSKLTNEQKEKTLREVEKKDLGERYLSLLMDCMFESLLGDPVYGSQPNFVGWKWLKHIPGFPRPDKPHSKVV